MKQVEKQASPKKGIRAFWEDETGDIGVKQIAVTVGVIVIIGLIIGAVNDNLATWIDEVWKYFMKIIQDLTDSAA
ncbi:MAG: hypothetical protein E7L01_01145 [Paenibacillus macerans]|uniref:hypothetical protein n=1 Tax=Paenibacillus TaxID=44249 RepID=UPI001B2B7528|nr:hypothetical protein [Paenibacillus macerans]MBS5914423.1 hypothetical protein [Paenibacillus macerans]MDU7471952.1 hypothetical protein [Paenibacillus macerans]GIP09488.1 hypothetical protein J1TS5_16580 [Paenibacillus macerans]